MPETQLDIARKRWQTISIYTKSPTQIPVINVLMKTNIPIALIEETALFAKCYEGVSMNIINLEETPKCGGCQLNGACHKQEVQNLTSSNEDGVAPLVTYRMGIGRLNLFELMRRIKATHREP